MAVKAIVHTHTSMRDIYGNCYSVSEIENILTGEKITFHSASHNNAVCLLTRYVGWNEYRDFEECHKIRRYNEIAKCIEKQDNFVKGGERGAAERLKEMFK